MKTKVFLFFAVVLTLQIFSQEIPTINVGEKVLKLESIDIKVVIIGNKAITTYDMLFSNTMDRVLEGELSFPLGEGGKVSRFALEINGNLREAVVVEKEVGRVAFENTIRQNIDPALLEQTKGNNYKARIYPIPANGTKRVVLAYDQVLINHNNSFSYLLPINFKNELDKFSLNIEVFNQDSKPRIVKGDLNTMEFNNWNRNYVLSINKNNFLANTPLLIEIPIEVDSDKLVVNGDYFYLYKSIQSKVKLKKKPNSITILWDASYSMRNRNIEKELTLLDLYFKNLESLNVNLVSFSNTIKYKSQYKVIGGNWDKLKKHLKDDVVYDGGTSFEFLKKYKDDSDEYLLFSDGLINLSKNKQLKHKAIYTINSIPTSNHQLLSQVAENSGGAYLNLINLTESQSLELLTHKPYRFLGVNTKSEGEVYPSKSRNITSGFSLSGKGFMDGEIIELLFGFGNKVSEKHIIKIDKNSSTNDDIKKVWAEMKLDDLLENQHENKQDIVKLSKEHSLISPYTSLIVLDRVEDYVRYEITPPKELQEQFMKLKEIKEAEKQNEKDDFYFEKEELQDEYNELFAWWKTDFDSVKIKKVKVRAAQPQINSQNNTRIVEVENQQENSNYGTRRTISGIISDESGPLPGASIIVKGTTNGVESDFDGNYSIRVNEGDMLEVNFIGYVSVELEANNSSTFNIHLDAESESLNEVVVSGFGRRVERRSATYSVQSLEGDDLIVTRETNTSNALGGRIAGVQITASSGSVGASSRVVLRGASSIIGSSQPLYVVDGVPIDNTTYEISEINVDDIETMNVLKGSAASTLYGIRASNGVIVITTKNGIENNSEAIEKFEEMVSSRIELKGWDSEMPYIQELKKTENTERAYQLYLQLRNEYQNSPAFFIDVADFFIDINEIEITLRVLTNIAEMDIDNYELLRVLAYKLESLNRSDLAVFIYKEILNIRPEDIQSYRDLALVYEEVGQYQKSLNLLYKIVSGKLIGKDVDSRFDGVEVIALNEMNSLIARHHKELDINAIDKYYIHETSVDIRVVIDWNHNDTDIDLHVTDPNKEECFYKHQNTSIGGRISEDMVEGFGPEEFLLKKAIKGNYKIKVHYFADNMQKISGPTFLKLTSYLNFGKKNQKKKVTVVRLGKNDEDIIVADINI
ncbi:MAG: TonB-dependent receptor plug domain-containing protein [Flavobacteriaceae bacterium]